MKPPPPQHRVLRKEAPRYVLGVDPGTRRLGWGVIAKEGPRVRGIEAGVIRVDEDGSLEARLAELYDGLREVLGRHPIGEVAVEDIFYARFPQAALRLGHARGVALLAAAHAGCAVFAYPPAVVKRAIAGRGAADKTQVAKMVGVVLGWSELPTVDATDALAIAITHMNARQVRPKARPPALHGT